MLFKRDIHDQLKKWASKPNRKPLVLRGARQVGKTTVVNEFGKEFDTYLYVNIEKPNARQIFEIQGDVEDVLTAIYLYCNKPRLKNKTLLFIDEIQQSPQAVALLRYFYEEFPELYVIAAGSLLESLLDKHISFPVGRVEYMVLRPCSFVEFLRAIGEDELRKALVTQTVPEGIHHKCIQLFNAFSLIGGMPEVVSHYATYRDLVAIREIYDSILNGYKDDVEKYATGSTITVIIRYIIKEGWAFAAQRIKLASFAGSSYKSREMGEAFRALEKTMLLELVYPTIHARLPVNPELNRSPKLLWLDTGLVNYAAGLQKEVFNAKDIMDAWRGSVAEQIVAQELLSADYSMSGKRRFWVREKKGSDAEVDFIIQTENGIIPVEVKSGHNSKLKSLHAFMDLSNQNIAVRVWSKPFSIDTVTTTEGKEFKLFNVPFYYVGVLSQLLTNY